MVGPVSHESGHDEHADEDSDDPAAPERDHDPRHQNDGMDHGLHYVRRSPLSERGDDEDIDGQRDEEGAETPFTGSSANERASCRHGVDSNSSCRYGRARSPVLKARAAARVRTSARADMSTVRARARLRSASRTSGKVERPFRYDSSVASHACSEAASSAAAASCFASATLVSLYDFHTSRTALSVACSSSAVAWRCVDSARRTLFRRSNPSNSVHSSRKPASYWSSCTPW